VTLRGQHNSLDFVLGSIIIWLNNQIIMGRPSNTSQRRSEIVQALLEVMAKTGYDGASIGSIAEAAGLAPGLVHYHFANKQEILLALGEELVRRVRERQATRSAEARDHWDRLFAFTDARVALSGDADPDAAAAWVVFGAEALRQPAVKKRYQRVLREDLRELEALLRPLLSSDRSRAADIAATLSSAIEGAYHLGIVARVTPRGFAAPMLRELAQGLVQSANSRARKGVRRA
jgi:TetR/AcrR family transcriptional repressor of bet genes